MKRRSADVIGEAMHTGRWIIIECQGRPAAAIGPTEENAEGAAPGWRPAELRRR